MEMLENDATPPTAATVVVPDSVPPAGFVPIASVIGAVELVTVFPFASCTMTTTAGIAAPAAVFVGCAVIASFAAAPGVMLNALLVAPVSPAAVALSV